MEYNQESREIKDCSTARN